MSGGGRKRRPRRSVWVACSLLVLIALGGVASLAFRPGRRSAIALAELPRAPVVRTDLKVTLTAGGRVESTKRTLIECELENLQFKSQGHAFSVDGSSTIIYLIPDGSFVKEGELLCKLDSSEYEEIVRQQKIKVEEARAGKTQAELDMEVAQLAVKEFTEGTKGQTEQTYRGQISLAKSDIQRASDRLNWSLRMRGKGYASVAQLATDKTALLQAQVNLQSLQSDLEMYSKYEVPYTLRTLEAAVENARSNLDFQTARFKRHQERLEHYEWQVEVCTIKAPHDGFVIYANEANHEPKIYEGATVRQRQDIFYLPDLANMEVQALLHESVVERVHDGMPAKVQVEALPGAVLEGHVVSVAPLPVLNPWYLGNDVKNYVGLVKLSSVPRSLRPGMSAQVEIVTESQPDVLVIPTGALSVENGHDICYVAGEESVERREVTVGASTRDYLEVTRGLNEGEEVVLDPAGHNVAEISVNEPGNDAPIAPEPVPAIAAPDGTLSAGGF